MRKEILKLKNKKCKIIKKNTELFKKTVKKNRKAKELQISEKCRDVEEFQEIRVVMYIGKLKKPRAELDRIRMKT